MQGRNGRAFVARPSGRSGLGLEAARSVRRGDRRAGARRHQLEGVALVVGGAGACAGRAGARIAVVLAFERDAEAGLDLAGLHLHGVLGLDFLLLRRKFLRIRGSNGERAEGGSEGASDQLGHQTIGHIDSPKSSASASLAAGGMAAVSARLLGGSL